MRTKAALVAAALLLWGVVAQSAEDSPHIERGQSLAAALESLRSESLTLIFSSALIGPDLVVDVEPGSGTPEDVARHILAPHGLTLEAIRPGLFAVVKSDAQSAASSARDVSSAQTVGKLSQSAADPLYEIDIYASRYKIEQQESTTALAELNREDLAALPGLDEDVLRVTRFLPGTASNALSSRSHVRGGRDDEVAVYFDGVPLFEPFHYKDVQSLLGMLDPESISTVDFFSGVFPARYGNRLSGVLDIAPRTWAGENYNAVGASVLYSHALSQGRLESYPVEWLASVRRGNVDTFADLIGNREAEPDFIDALGRVQVDLGSRGTLAAGWLLLDDELSVDLDDRSEVGDIEYRDATGWLSWRFQPIDQAEVRAAVSRTERHTNRSGSVDQPGNSLGTLDDRRLFDTTTVRLEANANLPAVTLNSGLEWYDYSAHYRYRSAVAFDPALAAAFGRAPTYSQSTIVDAAGEAYAAYASAQIGIAARTRLDVSIRWDAQRFNAAFNDDQWSPRVSLQFDYDPATIFRLSFGRASQTLRPDELQVQEGDLAFPAAQRATQIAASMERHLTPGALLRVELYDKRVRDPSPSFENLLDPFVLLPELEVDRVRIHPDRSRSYGAEFSLRWQLPERWSGWASYSWSQVNDDFGAITVPRTWDQKHAVTSGVAWTLRPWQLSTNATWHTGWRRNTLIDTPTGIELGPRNSASWAPYFSLDARAGWRRPLPKGVLDAFFEIDNLTNSGNPCCSNYRLSASEPGGLTRADSAWLPRLFLLGVTWQLP